MRKAFGMALVLAAAACGRAPEHGGGGGGGASSAERDRAIAAGFGKEAIIAVVHADGLLVTSEITGTDAGSAIDAVNRDQAQQAEALKKIEAQLAQPGLKPTERVELQRQAQQLRDA